MKKPKSKSKSSFALNFAKLILDIQRIAARKTGTAQERATEIRKLIGANSCYYCRARWMRGGNRQGSKLCQHCYEGD